MAEIMASAWRAALGHLAGETVEVFLRRIERYVRGAIGDVEEEGIVRVALDESGGGPAATVDVIHLRRQIAHRAVLAVERDVGRKRGLGVLCEDVGEAVLRDLRRGAEVPFAELGGGVTGFLQPRGDGGLLVEAIQREWLLDSRPKRLWKRPVSKPAREGTHCGAVL